MDCIDLINPGVDISRLTDDQISEILDEHKSYIINNKVHKRKVATSLVIAQQSAEIYLKARLYERKPELIFVNSNYKTVDSSKLIRIYNQNFETNIDADFARKYEKMRKLRNDFTHLLSYHDDKLIENVLDYILHINEVFGGGSNFMHRMVNDNSNIDISILLAGSCYEYMDKYNHYLINAFDYLKRSKVKKYFGIDIKRKMLPCNHCKNLGSYKTSQVINGAVRCLICHP